MSTTMYHYCQKNRNRQVQRPQVPRHWWHEHLWNVYEYDPWTTTSLDDFEPPQNTSFKGITAENDRPWTNACVVWVACVCTVPDLFVACCHSFPCHRLVGHPVTGITPPSCMARSRHASFCTGISMSYRNRYVAVASFSDSLPWHPFLAPWRQMLHNMLMSKFS